jgi:putative NADH-flavin reductase
VPFLETVRKILLAYKLSPATYFIFVGGAGSLHVPGTNTPCVDHPSFFLAYRRAISTSLAHISYMEDRLGIMGTKLRRYRTARLTPTPSDEDTRVIQDYEKEILTKDNASDFIKAGRTAYMFFDGNSSFNWSFVSPSALYRPGKRTGEYKVSGEEMVLVGEQELGEENLFEGRLTGISVGDMAVAIADEVEERKMVWRHWSAWGDLSEDVPGPSYVTLEGVEGGSR